MPQASVVHLLTGVLLVAFIAIDVKLVVGVYRAFADATRGDCGRIQMSAILALFISAHAVELWMATQWGDAWFWGGFVLTLTVACSLFALLIRVITIGPKLGSL